MSKSIIDLSNKEIKACREYLECGSMKQALLKAGYSESYSNRAGLVFFGREKIQKFLEKEREKTLSQNNSTVESLRKYWEEVMNDGDKPDSVRIRASENLAKSFGMFMLPEKSKGKQAPTITGSDELED